MRARTKVLIVVAILATLLAAVWAGGVFGGNRLSTDAEQVVLLHGLGRTENAMWYLRQRLVEEGYRVVNVGYPSRSESPESLVDHIRTEIEEGIDSGRRVHFVTHSLGGLLARAYLQDRPIETLGRVVMLGPPNKGSEIVDEIGDHWLVREVIGPTGSLLGTGPDGLPRRLEPPYYEVGVIAGNFSFNPIGSNLIPGEDDGTVAVESTKLEGMTDFRVFSVSHTFLAYDNEVADQAIHFLQHGRFQ
jgi:pimeloyl-ACP methyl ester carboxylesterase